MEYTSRYILLIFFQGTTSYKVARIGAKIVGNLLVGAIVVYFEISLSLPLMCNYGSKESNVPINYLDLNICPSVVCVPSCY